MVDTSTECGISLPVCFEHFEGGSCAESIVICSTKAK